MNILCIGDIVGKPGREAVETLLPTLIKEYDIEFVIANVENAAGGSGIIPRLAESFLSCGCDVLTTGDHVWDKKEILEFLGDEKRILRPCNFPEGSPGKGFCVTTTKKGNKIAVINLLGRVFMRYNVNCPFKAFEHLIKDIRKETPNVIVDFHAEATSEKIAFGHFADGKASGVFGTHTHVQTADEKILQKKTGYITDVGMTGPFDSVIGQNKEKIIERFLKSMPSKFEVASEDVWLNGVVFTIDEQTGLALNILRIQRRM
ncbi:MAG: TIGR00282 family metallophosphoesterase [Candidatus Omnitrophica bacterium]|nr:TIGR00282 family metallophosphoesterase [Candidatus Omnitrophota bacterium]